MLTGDELVKSGCWSQDRDPYLLETSVPGIFACGDVRLSPVKRVAAAVGEGSMAIALVHQYLRRRAIGRELARLRAHKRDVAHASEMGSRKQRDDQSLRRRLSAVSVLNRRLSGLEYRR